MVGLATKAQNSTVNNWENGALEAGVSKEQLEDWRRKSVITTDKTPAKVEERPSQAEIKEAATRLTWYAFGGTLICMMAAAAGAWMGAGPTFRIVSVRVPARGGIA